MCVYTVYVTLCNHDLGAQGKSSMTVCKVGGPECMLKILLVIQYFRWFSPITSHDCLVILPLVIFSLELLMDNLQEFGMFKYLLWPKFSQIFQKCSAKNKVSNHPIIVCYSSPASPLGVPSQAPSRLIRCLFEDCDGKKHFGTDVSSMTKGCKRLSWMCTPVSIYLKITLGIFHRHVTGCTKK